MFCLVETSGLHQLAVITLYVACNILHLHMMNSPHQHTITWWCNTSLVFTTLSSAQWFDDVYPTYFFPPSRTRPMQKLWQPSQVQQLLFNMLHTAYTGYVSSWIVFNDEPTHFFSHCCLAAESAITTKLSTLHGNHATPGRPHSPATLHPSCTH